MGLVKLNNRSSEDTAIHGRRNLIINGAMQINQRGHDSSNKVTVDVTAGGTDIRYSVDRWQSYGYNVTGDFDIACDTYQHGDHPTLGNQGNCVRVDVTTADATIGTGVDFFVLRQPIEAYTSVIFDNKKLSLSFWVKTNVAGTYGVQFRADGSNDGGDNPNFFTTYTVNAADTWEHKTITIPEQTISPTNTGNGIGYSLLMTLASGLTASYDANIGNCEDAWARAQSNGIGSTSLSNTLFASTSNYFQLTDVQLEVGDKATPFEHRSYGEELALCQRYYETSEISVLTVAAPNGPSYTNQTYIYGYHHFAVTKRSTPSMSESSVSVSTGPWTNAGISAQGKIGFTSGTHNTTSTNSYASKVGIWYAEAELL